MPLKRMLGEGRAFDPKAIAILLEAYDGMVSELGLRTTGDQESAAKLIMRVALDQINLDATASAMRPWL